VHGRPATFHLEEHWDRNLTVTTGLEDTYSTAVLLGMLTAGRLSAADLITHDFALHDMEEAYDIFSRSAETGALKVVLLREPH
jgi:alcohol dehydrogenase